MAKAIQRARRAFFQVILFTSPYLVLNDVFRKTCCPGKYY
jgi:hypothetical protein